MNCRPVSARSPLAVRIPVRASFSDYGGRKLLPPRCFWGEIDTRSDPFKNWGNGGKRVNKGEIKIVSWVFDLIAVTFSFSDFLNLLF